MTVEEIKTNLLARGVDVCPSSIDHYKGKALVLMYREAVFGSDAQRMFSTSKSTRYELQRLSPQRTNGSSRIARQLQRLARKGVKGDRPTADDRKRNTSSGRTSGQV